MDENATIPRPKWSDAALVTVLILVGAGIHGWVIAHTEVAARDSIGFIRYALALQNRPWTEVLQHAEQHPVYPLTLLAVSHPVRYFHGTTCESLVLSAQLASALFGTLLVVPMFYLGRELFDRRVGFWTALLFQVLPAASRVTSDALSDATFYLLVTTALLLAARALRKRSPLELFLCGLCTALAYLTRPEGALVALVVVLVLLLVQAMPSQRWPWRRAAAGALGLSLAFGMAAGPYMLVIGSFSRKPTPRKFFKLSDQTDTLPPSPDQARITGGPLLAIWWNGGEKHTPHPPLRWGAWALGREVIRASQSFLWLPVVLGLWRYRKKLAATPGMMVILILAGIYSLILMRMAVEVGYLSERHSIFLMLCGMYWAAAELLALGDLLAARLQKRESWRPRIVGAGMSILVLALLSEAGHPLHANRAGHRAAGIWLRDHYQPGDEILDPFCWAHFYAGAVFAEGTVPPPGFQQARYIVLERSTNQHSRLPLMGIAREVARRAVLVYRWTPQPSQRKERAEEVLVYAILPAGRVGSLSGIGDHENQQVAPNHDGRDPE